MTCTTCKTANRPGADTCKGCSAALPPSCAGCGHAVATSGELCPACRTERVPAALGTDLVDLVEADAETAGLDGGAEPLEFHVDPAFVGRTSLVDSVEALVARAVAERALRFVALLGPAGIGKSRLAREIGRRVRTDVSKARVLVGACGGTNAPPFAAYARMLAARFGITGDDGDAAAQEKIARGVEAALPAARAGEVTHLVAHLVGRPFTDSPVLEPLADAPPQLEARLFIAVRRFLAAEAERGPVVMILDDVERASPETVNLTHYLAAGLAGQPVVLLAVGRTTLFDAHPSFGEGEVALERFDVPPLAPEESAALLRELFRGVGEPPPRVVRHAADHLGGMPRALFELVRYLHESGVITAAAPPSPATTTPVTRWRLDEARLGDGPLPTSLEELIAARLRAMEASERDLLEKAATCGEAFWLDALVALVRAAALVGADPDGPSLAEIAAAGDRTRTTVAASLRALERRGLVVHSTHPGIPGETEYRFAYPPWWDVVYDSVSTEARGRYHRMLAQWLELRPEGRDEERQEEVAHHLERAGDGVGASQRYRRAADAARLRYFNAKAIRLYGQALECLGASDVAARIQLWHDLGSVYHMQGEHESAIAAYERMLRLTWVVSSRTKGGVALNKMGRVYRQKGDLEVALEYLERGLDLFEQVGDERGVAGSLDDIGQVLWLTGRYDEALDRSAAALETRRRLGDKRSVATSLLNIGNIERHRGLFDEAAACYREALELRRGMNDRQGIASTLNGLGVLAFQRGDLDGARREWDEALGIAEEIGALPLLATLEAHLAELALALGSRGEARTRFERAHELAQEIDDRRMRSEATRQLGLIALQEGAIERARELCTRAHDLAEAAGIAVNVGRALVALGEVHAATLFDDAVARGASAADYFQRGVELFRRIGNEAELAAGLERFGKYQVERGDVDAGRRLLTEAQEIFARLGMRAGASVQRMITELGV